MFSHITALAKSPKLSKATSLSSHSAPYGARSGDQLTSDSSFASIDGEARHKARHAESHFNSELETLRQHNAEEPSTARYSGRLRANSAQTINSILTSSTHTTNTNSATSPGVFQPGFGIPANTRPDSMASQSSSISYLPKSGTRVLISPFSQSNHSKDSSGLLSKGRSTPPPARRRFRTLSNASFSMRRERSAQQPQQLEVQLHRQHEQRQRQQQQQQQQQQQRHRRAHTDQISTDNSGQQQLEEHLLSRPTSASNYQDVPRKAHLPGRSTSQNHDSRPPPSAERGPRNERRHSSIPRPVPTPLKITSHSFTTSLPESAHTSRSTPNSRPRGSDLFSASGPLPSELSSFGSAQSQPQKRWSIVDTHIGSHQAPLAPTDARPNPGRAAHSLTRVATTSLAVPTGRRHIKQKASSPERPHPSRRQSTTPIASQEVRVRPESLINPSNFPTEAPAGFKFNPTMIDEHTHASQQPQIPIRQESPEELIQYLERLIGYDELRLLTHVDKLLHQCMYTFLESESTKQVPQDSTHPNRRSIGNGILGRLGWKNKKGTSTPEPLSRSKSNPRAEYLAEDRRATFGLWAGAPTRPVKGGVFGSSLEDGDTFSCVTVIGGHKHLIPIVIFSLVEEIYARGMETPGFMRIAGKAEKIDALADAFEHAPLNRDGVDLASEDIHVLCSLFKRYLRALPEPLMSRELFHILWSFCVRQRKSTNPGHLKSTIAAAQCIMRLMPPRSFSLLIYVVAFLSQIPLFPQCKFSSTGIAKIFGPALFASRTQRNPASDERPIQALKWVLENWNMLTDGLLNEHFTVNFSESPPPMAASTQTTCVSEPSSPEPSYPSPIGTPMAGQDVTPPELQSPEELATDDALEPTSANSRRLLEWRSHSQLRKSNSSAQHIVDRYEAHEKNFPMTDDQVRHLKQETLDSLDEITVSKRPQEVVSHSPIIEFEVLPNIAEVTTETQVTFSSGDDHPHPEQPTPDIVGETFSRQSLIEGEDKPGSKSTRTQILVLNEPFEPTSGMTKPIADSLTVPEYKPDIRAVKGQSAVSGCPTLKSLDTAEVDNLIIQGLQLRETMSREKLCDCHTEDRDRAERMLKESIALIQTHQDMLSRMKSQLIGLLNQEGEN
ncbi:hypothetical protein PtA15_3A509 [Puccinia triticina]|uniref:Rho-GAP domain-containing protein n=1 Tax=Puccinia triticina TaxID=208348 RepID=A0ABY7CK07_9BASI|nr:uncharacterized protein PtA15_3A509 [Puccinia triticina]WAQ83142.1 hypothetical protein PtA15_3A509 [Puccinia triticina]